MTGRSSWLFICVLLWTSMVSAADGPRQSTKVPRFDAAVDKGVAYLKSMTEGGSFPGGQQSIIAYALYKCAIPKTDPYVSGAIDAALARCTPSGYRPVGSYDHIYGAGVDAMLLADTDSEKHREALQRICSYVQSAQRSDGSWSDTPTNPGDVSMSQYGVLALWACQRAGCQLSPEVVDRAADFFMRRGQPDGGWAYRPGTAEGPGGGNSTHNMTVAGAGALGICRLMLHGSRNTKAEKKEQELVFGALEKMEEIVEPGVIPSAFPDYKAQSSAGEIDARVARALDWNRTNLQPVSRVDHNLYYYYCLERAAAVGDIGNINGQDWFVVYGDGLLSLQAENGRFDTYSGPVVGTAFALLYYMRSTDKILESLYGKGQLRADKGDPFGEKKRTKDPSELDQLLASMEKEIDFTKLDESDINIADEVVASVQSIDDPKELIGQKDRLKKLIRHPNADVRRSVYWALGRTGDFALVPEMLEGLKDVDVDVNVEAEMALRFIARKPNGFGASMDPYGGLEASAPAEERVRNANDWRVKTYQKWSEWYFSVRPFEERDGFDELEAATFSGVKSETPKR